MNSRILQQGTRRFSSKNDDDDGPSKSDLDIFEKQRLEKNKDKVGGVKAKVTPSKATSALKAEAGEEPVAPKRKRRTKAEMEAAKLDQEIEKAQQNLDKVKQLEGSSPNTEAEAGKQKLVTPETMYTLKFNSPILPYAKFPLTQNKYI